MKKTIVLIVFIFSTAIVSAEFGELHRLVYSAKSMDKLILLKVFNSDNSGFPFDSISHIDRFIGASLYASNPSDIAVINEYRVESYPSIILLNSNGHLILPVKKVDSIAGVEAYMEKALRMKHESKPLAQFDLEYLNNKMNKASLYEYIGMRTSLGLNNSEIIDKYTALAAPDDILNMKTLMLFIDENSFNIPGSFCSFMLQYQEEIRQILKLGDERFHRLTEKSVEHSFQEICRNRDEPALTYIIDIKANTFNAGDRDILRSEYLTRYFYITRQPLKLVNHAREYVNAVLQYKEHQEKDFRERNKRLFCPPFGNSAVQAMCASRLRDAAQYVVEMTSAKSFLNDALSWTVMAEQMADGDRYSIYETHAYIVYKLGKRDEAIANMEKAYSAIPRDDMEQKTNIGFNLIKMKRGEKVY
ncbi:MAG: hypothetical protein LBK97_04635 [Prevotellaceae bacterium]|jgi:hypothetical protein|nr:hypothetical protein [Prevotellaceae bacterium]